jgi:hypothetical protein
MSVILIYVFSKETEDIWVKGLREGPLSIQSNTSQPALSTEPLRAQRRVAANERT